MSLDFDRLSSGVVGIISEILKNQDLVNTVGYDGNLPTVVDISPSDIAPRGTDERIIPHAFDDSFVGEERTEIHIYYPDGEIINNGHVGKNTMFFEIIVHKNIWLMMDGNKKVIRPYRIIKLIHDTLANRPIAGVGKVYFKGFEHILVNEEFEGIRLYASLTEF